MEDCEFSDVWDLHSVLWWNASVRINTALGGDPSEPLCSRVYRMNNSAFRTYYLVVMDFVFSEKHHCRKTFRKWVRVWQGEISAKRSSVIDDTWLDDQSL